MFWYANLYRCGTYKYDYTCCVNGVYDVCLFIYERPRGKKKQIDISNMIWQAYALWNKKKITDLNRYQTVDKLWINII